MLGTPVQKIFFILRTLNLDRELMTIRDSHCSDSKVSEGP